MLSIAAPIEYLDCDVFIQNSLLITELAQVGDVVEAVVVEAVVVGVVIIAAGTVESIVEATVVNLPTIFASAVVVVMVVVVVVVFIVASMVDNGESDVVAGGAGAER